MENTTLIDHTVKFMNLAIQYAFNFESDFITKAELQPTEHMELKFSALYAQHGATFGFIRFWSECDAENRKLLMAYILRHYATTEEISNESLTI